jgi:hypothetical protein
MSPGPCSQWICAGRAGLGVWDLGGGAAGGCQAGRATRLKALPCRCLQLMLLGSWRPVSALCPAVGGVLLWEQRPQRLAARNAGSGLCTWPPPPAAWH